MPSSQKKVFWCCSHNHSWRATIHSRVYEHTGCPYCKGTNVISGVNDLATLNPQICIEWDYELNGMLTPDLVSIFSNKEVYWKCSQGHSWKAAISHRSQGTNCPICANKKVVEGVNDLATTNPLLMNEWDFLLNKDISPTMLTKSSLKKVWWICGEGHSWEATIISRTKGTNCPICSNKKVLIGNNDLMTTYPQLCDEWDKSRNILLPTEVTYGSEKKVWWVCNKGHNWEARVYDRVNGSECPYCQNKKLIIGVNDLLTKNPLLAQEWNYEKNYPLQPNQVRPYTNKKVWWVCKEGHEWEANISRWSSGDNCPFCSKYKVHIGENDLITCMPSIAREWDYESNKGSIPENFSVNSLKSVYWKCTLGHSYKMRIKDKLKGGLCPVCTKSEGNIKVNSLLITNPELVLEWDYKNNGLLTPGDISSGSGKKVWWKCIQNHSWEATVFSRVKGSKCPYCSGRQAIPGENDLKTCYPSIAQEWDYKNNHPLLPENFKPHSHKVVSWKCKYGHTWKAAIYSRTLGGQCPKCRNLL